MMKLSKETTEILKNFATINPSLIFQAGSVQKTVSPQKTILAKANITETFDREFAIYDLTQFISTVSLFEDPELKLGEDSVVISNGRARTTLRYAKSELIQSPPSKEINLPSSDIQFTLDKTILDAARKAANVLSVPELAFVGRGGKSYLTAIDSRNQGSNTFEYEVGTASTNYIMIFKTDNLNLLPRDYDITISSKGISHFKSKSGDVEYWIATEQGSKYGE
jgi:hypothetical protein